MCEVIFYYREFVFYFFMVTASVTVMYMSRHAKSRGINFDSILGLIEVYRLVFTFDNKKFSVVVLSVLYGNMLLVLLGIVLFYWGRLQGCVF